MMKRSLLNLLFCCAASLFAAAEPLFLFDEAHLDSVVIKDGAVLENGILKLNGKKGHAEFKESGGFSFAESGMTLLCEARLFAAQNGAKAHTGRLTAFDADTLTLTPDGGEAIVLSRKGVSKVSTLYEEKPLENESQT